MSLEYSHSCATILRKVWQLSSRNPALTLYYSISFTKKGMISDPERSTNSLTWSLVGCASVL